MIVIFSVQMCACDEGYEEENILVAVNVVSKLFKIKFLFKLAIIIN